jgi:membrane-bound lytic murein transglycosylase A
MRVFVTAILMAVLAACTTTPAPEPAPPSPPQPPAETPAPPVTPPVASLKPVTRPVMFSQLPGWGTAALDAGVSAFRRSCARIERRSDTSDFWAKAAWTGKVGEWRGGCAAVGAADDEASARTIIETLFKPVEIISGDGKTKFTGYFEPRYAARKTPEPGFTEPVPKLPSDFVPNGEQPLQRLSDGTTRPYPTRADITAGAVEAIAYAHPTDVFFLQIQGSGRLLFPDGTTLRAAYAGHNGQPYKAAINWLIETGRLPRAKASMQGIREWMDAAGPEEARLFMNQNPRFVFFNAFPEGDPSLGPNGAQSVPLTPLGSMAIDPDIHALGAPMFVETSAPGLGGKWSGLLIAQDTGGAIKGAVRGDLYFGTGFEAGERAGTMNAPGRLWVLLPNAVAARLAPPPNSDRPVAP